MSLTIRVLLTQHQTDDVRVIRKVIPLGLGHQPHYDRHPETTPGKNQAVGFILAASASMGEGEGEGDLDDENV